LVDQVPDQFDRIMQTFNHDQIGLKAIQVPSQMPSAARGKMPNPE
jgi:hypothetical protein